ncbi:hypothetical protein MRX96_021277 [Rhipicephalus microplus]
MASEKRENAGRPARSDHSESDTTLTMKSFALVFCYSLFAAASSHEKYEFLRDALTTICRAVESWVENNTALEPMELQRRLEKLVDDTLERNKAFAAIGKMKMKKMMTP